jgi:predicted nucleic acid-binding protein
MKTVYIETSIVSYLTARPSRSILAAAWQQATEDWWSFQRSRFELFTSELVVKESEQGNTEAAQRRIAALTGIHQLAVTDAVSNLAAALLDEGALPSIAADDAMHVAVAAYHGVDYLLTWNCRHIDNAEKKPVIRSVCVAKGYQCPEICTPMELMGDTEDER